MIRHRLTAGEIQSAFIIGLSLGFAIGMLLMVQLVDAQVGPLVARLPR